MHTARSALFLSSFSLLIACGGPAQAPALRVLDVSPEGQVEALDAKVIVRFDRPAIPAEQVGKPAEPAPVTLSPSVGLTAHWSDRQTLVLTPKALLSASTRYELVFGNALQAQLGEQAGKHAFIAGPVRVTRVLGMELNAAPPQPTFSLNFSVPVKPSEVAAHCSIAQPLGAEVSPLKTGDADQPSTAVSLAATKRLTQGQQYELHCKELVGVGGNAAMPESFSQGFTVYPQLALLGLEPQGGNPPPDELQLKVVTTTPIDTDQLGKLVKLKPTVAGLRDAWSHDEDEATHQHAYLATVNLEAQTDYELSVDKGLTDQYGQELAEGMKVSFRTADARPSIKMETGVYALEKHAAGYPLWTRNVSDLEILCARVPKERVVSVLTSEASYEPWYGETSELDWKPLKLKTQVAALSTGKAKNKWTLTEIDLGQRCEGKAAGSNEGGLYLAELRSNQVKKDVEARGYGRYPYRVLANRTNLGVLTKLGPGSGLIWVSHLSDASPASGAQVSLYDPNGKKLFAGATDAQGLVRVPGSAELIKKKPVPEEEEEWGGYRDQRVIAMIEHEGDFAVVDGTWQDGLQSWNFNIQSDQRGGKTRIRGFIQSDRGIYRPGETAHFKGLVREVALGQSPRVPSGEKVKVSVEDSRGNEIVVKQLPLSPFGGFTLDVPLSEVAELGDWYVKARIAKQDFQETFTVEEIRPVAFEIKADPPKTMQLHERRAVGFTATYLFGAPVAGATVSYTVERRRHYLSFDGFSEYSFDDGAANEDYYYWYDDYDRNPEIVSQADLTADNKGRFSVPLFDPDKKLDQVHDYLVSVSVSDETDQAVSKRVAITAHSRSHYLGVAPEEWVQKANTPFGLSLVAVDTEGKRIAANATLSLVRRTWDCNGYWNRGYRCERKDTPISSQPIALAASGSPRQAITVSEPGEVVAILEGEDAQGRKLRAAASLWVIGQGEVSWGGDPSTRMQLIANKAEYAPGETATLVARANLGGSKLLVTTEREGVRDAFVVEPKSNGEGISIPITAAFAPNMFVSIARIRGRTGDKPDQGPEFQLGMIELKVKSEDKRLSVALQTEKEDYRPGERVRGTLRVSSGGAGVRSEVALSVADEGVLQLINFKTPDPMARFYEPFGLGVETAANWQRIAKLPDPSEEAAEEGADGGGGESDRIRSRFVASALWLPMLVTDDNGEVAFELDAPDNLTAFRLMAVAADVGDRFGSGESRVRINKPLLVQPVVPRFFSQGDEIAVGGVVHNYTEQAGTVNVEAKLTGLTAKALHKSVKLEPGGSARVVFDTKVDRASHAKVEIHARMGEHGDAFELEVPVHRPLATDYVTLVDAKLDTGASYSVDWPAGLDASESVLELTVDRSGLASLGPSLRYLVQYPYGCLEQTLSSFIPLLQARELGKSLDVPELRGAQAERFIRIGLDKVLRHQREDGTFSLWPGGQSYPHLSVYAAQGLLLAKQAKLPVPEKALQSALAAVRAFANQPERKLEPGGDTGTVAMAAYVLALAGEPDPGLTARLYEARGALPLYGNALLLRALVRSKGSPEMIRAVLGETLLALETESVWDPYDRYYYMSTPTRDRAIVLSALIDLDPHHPEIPELVERLKAARLEGGYWGNTQENAYALMAFADLARANATGKATVRVSRGDKLLTTLSFSGGEAKSFRRTLAELPAGELTIEPSSPVFVAIRQRRVSEVTDNAPIARGFTLKRTYQDLAGGQPVDQVKPGQLVKVTLSASSDRGARYVALVDPLPSGFEPVNARLATEEGALGANDVSSRWWWSYTAEHDDRAVAFLDTMSPHEHVHEHVIRATSAGTFTAAPATIEAMYEPTRMASTSPAIMRVAP